MEIIRINLSGRWDDLTQSIIEQAAEVIRRGGVLVYPTDTVYGIGVNVLDEQAVARLFKIKKRPESKPLPVMVKDIAMAKKLAYIDKKKEKILAQIWPGAVTVVLEKKNIVSSAVTGGQKTIGLRVPDHPLTGYLMENLDVPVAVTSANFSGQPPINYSRDLLEFVKNAYPRPDLVLDAGDLLDSQPSTVLDLTAGQPKITRIGPITKKDLDKMIK